jgi:adenosylmethionine-8-amino-7-oxononanoate aminotransferase
MTDNLWLHFARHGPGITPPIITRGEGVTIWDDRGKSYLDALSGLFTVQVGHGRAELAEAAARQASTLAFFPLWGYATPTAIELAERLARYAPGDLNRVFFTTGGTEAVETAWKLAKQYFKLTGKPGKHKVISRSIAYHGTTHGALAITGLPLYKAPFEPVTPGGFRGSGPPTGSPRPSSSKDPRPSPRSSWNRCKTPVAASLLPLAISKGSGRSATSTTCCWSPTR